MAYVIGVEGLSPCCNGAAYAAHGQVCVSLALFVVVMYIGVFAKGSKVHQWLAGAAASCPLSHAFWLAGIWRCIWAPTPRLGGTLGVNVVSALVVALALLVLLLVLA